MLLRVGLPLTTLMAWLVLPTEGGTCSHLNNCNGHGTCDDSARKCNCFRGWGAREDVSFYRAPDCSQRTCPSDKAWVDIPSGPRTAHAPAECSNQGICDRRTGLCRCFAGFEGDACQRTACPNDCSGHGRCVSLENMAREPNAFPVGPTTEYGGAESTTTWDQNKLFGCVCDSAWAVGLGSGERQEPTYFAADCSKRHCPSGDDPGTPEDDEDCFGFLGNREEWLGGFDADGFPDLDQPPNITEPSLVAGEDYGASGNRCHIDCSRRGLCDFDVGQCRCFTGYYGENCSRRSARARGRA